MSINNLNTYLNIKDSHLRVVSGNVYAQAMNIGGINVETAHGLQSVSNTGNVTSNTLQFSNAITGFVTTANAQIGRDLVVSGNATVSTDLTVSANATVADTLTISEHLIASKEATVTGNLHVTTIRSDSNVVTEYTGPHDRPLRKYPEVALTADAATASGYKGYKVEKSSESVGSEAWHAFDASLVKSNNDHLWTNSTSSDYGDTNNTYNGTENLGSGAVDGEWIKLRLPRRIKVEYMKFYNKDQDSARIPKDFKLYGSNDNTNWTQLLDVTDQQTLFENTFNVNAVAFYEYIGLVVTRISGQPDFFRVLELEYYGHEEGSGSLDTTLKTVYNVPATTGTQLEVYYDAKETSSYPESGVTVTDISPNTNNGTLNGGVGFDPTYKAFTFDGSSSQNITSSALGFTGDQPHTFSFWIKDNVMNHPSTYVMHIGRTTHAASQNSSIEFRSDRIRWASYANDIDYPLTGITSNTWYHITGSYVGGGATPKNKSLYVNGKKFDDIGHNNQFSGWETTAGDPISFQSGAFVTLGSSTAIGSTHFNGSIANFRLFSKALNADQIKELYDYQKDYFLGSKSQVTLYKGHLGIGVTEPSGQLELAGDERIQEYPPGPMDDYETLIPGHGVFCASASNNPSSAAEHYGTAVMTPAQYKNSYTFWGVHAYPYQSSQQVYYLSPDLNTSVDPVDVASAASVVWSGHNNADWAHLSAQFVNYPGANQLWITQNTNKDVVGIKSYGESYPISVNVFNKNEALTDYWESLASTYTSTSGGSPAVSTERLASNAPYGSWVTLKLPYEICLKSYEFTGAGTKSPKEGQIWGSTDGTTWSHVHTFTGGVADVKNNETVSGNTNYYSEYAFITTKITGADTVVRVVEIRYFGTPGPTTLDKGSLTLGRSLDVPRVSRYDVDTETPRPEKLVVDFDTTVNSSPTDISGKGNHGAFYGTAQYSAADKAFTFDGNSDWIQTTVTGTSGNFIHSVSMWVKSEVPSTSTTSRTAFHMGNAAVANQEMQIQFNYNSVGTVYLGTQSGWLTMSNMEDVIKQNQWHHIAYTYNGTNMLPGNTKFYIDGKQMTMGGGSSSTLNFPSSTEDIFIGRFNSSSSPNWWQGQISNIKLYSVALEPSEVKKLYNLGRTGRSMVISDTAVGIGKVPEAQLDVRGNISCDGVFRSENPIAFEAYYTDGTLSTTGTYLPNYVRYNYGGCYDQGTGRFYAPINGIYAFHWHAYTNQGDSTSRIFIDVNGGDRGQKGNSVQNMGQQLSFSIYLNAGDFLLIKGKDTYPLYFHGYTNHNMYSGHLVIAM